MSESPPEPLRQTGAMTRRLLTVGAPMAVALAATCFLYVHFEDVERERLRLVFEGQTQNIFNGLHENFDLYLETVQSIASLRAANTNFTRDEFGAFVARNLKKYRGIQALEWIPRVKRDRRAGLEEAMRVAGHTNFSFRHWTPDGKTNWTAGPEHWTEEYFPVYFMEPFFGNEAAFGIDLGSHPIRRAALDVARNSGQPIATAPVRLAQETGDQAGFLIFVPVYQRGSAFTATETNRYRMLEGFGLGVFRVGDIVNTVLAGRDVRKISLKIVDIHDADDPQALFGGDPEESGPRLSTTYDLLIGGREWEIRFTASQAYIDERSSSVAALILTGGIVLTLMLGYVLNMAGNRTALVEQTVVQRTQELRRSNERLNRESEERRRAKLEVDRVAVRLANFNEELRRSNEELGQFAYVASHDLKSPLRAIDNLAKWILEDSGDALPESAKEDLGKMRQRVDRMNSLLDALLSYSRVGRKEDDASDIDLSELVPDIVRLQAVPPGFTVKVPPDLPPMTAPRGAMMRIFGNLIGNALKHHDKSEGKVEITHSEHDDRHEFTVEDDGPGIPERYHERIFAMFQTLKPRDVKEGSGMGLALVKKTVEYHGGTVRVTSQEGSGASFTFTWPKENELHPRESS